MRIIAGHWKGRRLSRVPGSVRPTSDRLRESLFNVLGNRVEGSRWLDAFAGSGAVGLEALSRGAVFVLFNEKDRRVCEVVRHNLDICRRSDGPAVKGSYEVRAEDAFVLLRRVQAPVFDFVFLDPPYRFLRYRKLLERLLEAPFVGSDTLVLLEVFKKSPPDLVPAAFHTTRSLAAGDSRILFLRSELNRSTNRTNKRADEALYGSEH